MSLYLQNRPINEVYQLANYRPKHEANLSQYQPPKTCLQNLSIYQPYSPNTKPTKPFTKIPSSKIRLVHPPEKEIPLKLIPDNKSFLRQKFNTITGSTSPTNTHQFTKQKRSFSYISKQNTEKLTLGPSNYNPDQAFKFLKDQSDFNRLPQNHRSHSRRRIYSEQIMAKSLSIPGVGQYNLANVPATKLNCLSTQWQKIRDTHEIKKSQQKKRKSPMGPSPVSYNALPRSYSLFSTLKMRQKQNRRYSEYNRALKIKQEKIKKNQKGKVLNKLGPGKYLTLDDWRQKIADKKGTNFVAKPMPPSVYY